MCGITGAVALNGSPLPALQLKKMVDIVAHRGPDDAGYLYWQTGRGHKRGLSFGQEFTDGTFHTISPLLPVIEAPSGTERIKDDTWDLFFGHRRLSILDLSPRGHQPMADKSRAVWLVHNGEIYNFKTLRKELESLGYAFSSNTDTEVIIYGYEEWGIKLLERLNGIFAFALFDARLKKLFLCRDRYGVKPLYYSVLENDFFLFGSEIKSIISFPGSEVKVDLLALNEYFSFQNILSDKTLFEGVSVLPAGSYMEIDLTTKERNIHKYWDFDFTGDISLSDEEAEEALHHLIVEAVKEQTVSDVPIGSYLSGGMDSGTVTALLAKQFGRINTFTSGFDLSEAAEHEQSFDERELAEKMANYFQTEHYECVLHSGDMEEVMEELIWHLEDLRVGQCYPNYYVARLAGKFVKVVMAGTGGDELFGGYPWRYATALAKKEEDYIQNYYRYWKRLVRNRDKPRLFTGDVVSKLKTMNYNGSVPFTDHTLHVFKNVFQGNHTFSTREDQINNSLYFETKTFLHGLLTVEDKISMAHSLETRVPLLNNNLVDFAQKMPVRMKLKDLDHLEMFDENTPRKKRVYRYQTAEGKHLLRKAMSRIIPPEISDAKKQGFSAPDESWFRGRSVGYVRDVLLSPNAPVLDYIDKNYMSEVIDKHVSEKENKRLLIWSFLSFQWWLKIFIS
jgi:asparagine synthase (glutamine-hydrolysing)